MRLLVLAVLVLSTMVASKASCTKKGYWGENCSRLCGHCANNKHCDGTSGKCPEPKKGDVCEEGWKNKAAGTNKCDEPSCFGDYGCDHEGECIAPNYCKCTGGGAIEISMFVLGIFFFVLI